MTVGRGCADYDCSLGYEHWRREWDLAKQHHCCRRYGRGCALPEFDCNAYEYGWSPEQHEWCCEHELKGCPTTTTLPVTTTQPPTTTPPYDCRAGVSNWMVSWSALKKEYCCGVGGVVCQITTPPPASAAPPAAVSFNCNLGLATWQLWPEPKKAWCCENEQKGCPITTTQTPYDCDEGLSEWNLWPQLKINFCCETYGKGCPSECFEERQDDEAEVEAWTEAQKDWCCTHTATNKGCRFSCHEGQASPAAWSGEEQAWCCSRRGLGCTTEGPMTPHTTTLPFNCAEDFATWETTWSISKQAWCCKHQRRGCAVRAVPSEEDLKADIQALMPTTTSLPMPQT